MAARLGGDEFVIILPETGYEASGLVIQRIQDKFSEAMSLNRWPVTFSMGVVTFPQPLDSVDEMVKKADDLMYTAKNSGKNRILRETYQA
jgi:diguanylate cyclase (GGDEF)-like protein